MGTLEHSLLIISALLVVSVVASKVGSRLGVPALLFFLMIGIAAGPHGLEEVVQISPEAARAFGAVALAFILFAGGMDTRIDDVRPVVREALSLSTLGVVATTLLVGVFSQFCLRFSFLEGCLLGVTISSTDVAAVFSVLRSKSLSLRPGIAPLLELESALNDPMAVFLGIALLGLITHQVSSVFALLPLFFKQMILGVLLGWGGGGLGARLLNWLRLEFEGLYPVLSLGLVLLIFSVTQMVGGSGFLAVYVAGIVLGNRPLLKRQSLLQFQEGISWFMQIAMFLAMGLLVNPHDLWSVAPRGLALSVFIVFVARPVSVLLSLPGRRFTLREKGVIACGGLRGSVPIILALFLLAAHIPHGDTVFHLVFFVTFTSVLLQGTSLPYFARWLKVDFPEEARLTVEVFSPGNTQN